jgi:hypothetical protein
MKDIRPLITHAQSMAPTAVTAAANGAGVDTRDYGAVLAYIDAGALGGTATPTVTFKVQESDDNAAFTDVADSDLEYGTNGVVISAANNNANAVTYRTYTGAKRYVRMICSAVSGTTPSLPASAGFILGVPHAYLPL